MEARRVILITEPRSDDSAVLGPLLGALSEAGARAELITGGTAALMRIHGERADLVVVDFDAPSLRGMDALLQIRRIASRIPVLIVTAEDSRARRMWAVEVGVIGYVTKPFDGQALARFVAKVLGPYAGH